MYAAAGIVVALLGSTSGKAFDVQKLLFLFALLMVVVGVLMLRGRKAAGTPGAQCNRENAPKVLSSGLATGLFSAFCGMHGGLLMVPGPRLSTARPLLTLVGTSPVRVKAVALPTRAISPLVGSV